MNKAFVDKVKEYVDHGIEISKDAMGKVCNSVEDFGERSSIRLEITTLQTKKKKAFRTLGETVYNKLCVEKVSTLDVNDESLSALLASIETLSNDIAAKEEQLAMMTKKE